MGYLIIDQQLLRLQVLTELQNIAYERMGVDPYRPETPLEVRFRPPLFELRQRWVLENLRHERVRSVSSERHTLFAPLANVLLCRFWMLAVVKVPYSQHFATLHPGSTTPHLQRVWIIPYLTRCLRHCRGLQ